MLTAFFIYLLKVCICTIIFYGFYHVVLRNENFFQMNRFFLLGSIVLSFIIPMIQMTLPSFQQNFGALYLGLDEQLINGVAASSTVNTINWGSVDSFLFVIYMLGVLFFTVKMIGNILYIFRLKNKNSFEKKGNYYLINIGKPHSVFSFFNYIFWNKDLNYSEEETKQVLLHELVHVEQMHTLDIVFLEAVNILLWFNPVILWYKKSLKITHEFIADQQLFRKHNFNLDYVDLLMKEAKVNQNYTQALVHSFFNNQLKERLLMIKNDQKTSSRYRLLFGLPILLSLVFFFSCNQLNITQDNIDKEKLKVGSIYQACDFDENGLVVLSDGTLVTIDEMKDIVVERRKAEGDFVTKDQVFIITKEEMKRNMTIVQPTE